MYKQTELQKRNRVTDAAKETYGYPEERKGINDGIRTDTYSLLYIK